MEVVSNFDMKVANTKLILQIIRKNKRISRRGIQRISGLSWGTISMTTADLIKRNVLAEVDSNLSNLGRTPKELIIDPKHNLLIGVDVNISDITFLVSDFGGNLKASYSLPSPPTQKEEVLRILGENIGQLTEKWGNVIAVSFSMQGLINSKEGISLAMPFFQDWENVNLKQIFQTQLNVPVFVFHDPDCLMMNERFQEDNITSKTKNAFILRIDEGIGMSVLIDGKNYTGRSGLATEIGHMIIRPDGALCRCGNHGCLEAYSSATGVAARYAERTGEQCSVETIARRAEAQEIAAQETFDVCGDYLGIALCNLIHLLEPETILLTGTMMNYKHLIHPRIQRKLEENILHKPYQPNIKYSTFTNVSPALGAVLFAIDELSGKIITEPFPA